jgi:Ribonuclease G/E
MRESNLKPCPVCGGGGYVYYTQPNLFPAERVYRCPGCNLDEAEKHNETKLEKGGK